MSEKAFAKWLTDLFRETGEDEGLFIAAGDKYVRRLWNEELSIVEAGDDLIDNFSPDS